MKGKKARSGNLHPRREGGQTPLQRRIPKSGFSKKAFGFEPTTYVNISKILYCIYKGRLDPTKKITIRDLLEAGAISSAKYGVSLLGRGGSELKKAMMPDDAQSIPPLHIEVSSASKQAIDFIKGAGGSVTCVYRTGLTMRYHIRPDKWVVPPNDPQTPLKRAYSMEKLREKGAEVVYVPTEWFKDQKNVKKVTSLNKERKRRAEILREVGQGTRIKPMYTRKVSFFVGRNKKQKTKFKSLIPGKGKGKGKEKGIPAVEKKETKQSEEKKVEAKEKVESDKKKERRAQSADAKTEAHHKSEDKQKTEHQQTERQKTERQSTEKQKTEHSSEDKNKGSKEPIKREAKSDSIKSKASEKRKKPITSTPREKSASKEKTSKVNTPKDKGK